MVCYCIFLIGNSHQAQSQRTNESLDDDMDEYVYKILVVGDLGCGKTSFIHRYVNHFALKTLKWDNRTSIRLQLWDIAGQERFGHMTRVYYKEAVGAMIVFDVTREKTFHAVTKWKTDIDDNLTTDGVSIPVVLLANKIDLAEEPLDKEQMDRFCKENGFVAWFETSAKENINIDEAGTCLVEHILKNDPKVSREPPPNSFRVTAVPQATDKDEKSCSC